MVNVEILQDELTQALGIALAPLGKRDDLLGDGQSQTRPSVTFGGIEGIEDALAQIIGDTGPIITDGQHHPLARRIKCGFDLNHARRLGHRVNGIGDDVPLVIAADAASLAY